jgi:hypothetical protein
MALYKYGSYFQESKDKAFDTDHIPGNSAPYGDAERFVQNCTLSRFA